MKSISFRNQLLFAVAGGAEGGARGSNAKGKPFGVAVQARPKAAAFGGLDGGVALVFGGGELLAGKLELLVFRSAVLLRDSELLAALFAGRDGIADRGEVLLRDRRDGRRCGILGRGGRNGDADGRGERQLLREPLRDLLRRLDFCDGIAHGFELRLEGGVALLLAGGERGGLLLGLVEQLALRVDGGGEADLVVVRFEPGIENERTEGEESEHGGDFEFGASGKHE